MRRLHHAPPHFFATFFLLGTALPAVGSLFTTETRQATVAVICTDGTFFCINATESREGNSGVNSVVHANNFDSNLTTPSEARTAARSGALEIAANATIRHRNGGPFQNYTDVYGDTIYEWDALVVNEGNVSFTFDLPPGFVEVQSNGELQNLLPNAEIQADIQFCSPACAYSAGNTSLFQMFSELEANFQTFQLSNGASSVNSALDTSALEHENVVLTDEGFIRTWTWAYEPFTGQIPLGHFDAGDTFTISYRLRGEVYSEFGAFQTAALAAINDPFFLSADFLPQQDALTFGSATVKRRLVQPDPPTVRALVDCFGQQALGFELEAGQPAARTQFALRFVHRTRHRLGPLEQIDHVVTRPICPPDVGTAYLRWDTRPATPPCTSPT